MVLGIIVSYTLGVALRVVKCPSILPNKFKD
jgi:hypothetical protein